MTDTIRRDAEAFAAEVTRPVFEALRQLEGAIKAVDPIVQAVEHAIKRREVTKRLFVEEIRECPACGHVHSMFNVREE